MPGARSGVQRSYCLSYTAVALTFSPLELVPLVVTVRVLASAEYTILDVLLTLPPCLAVEL